MSLIRNLSPLVRTGVRRRAIDLYHYGRVTITETTENQITATVHGGDDYAVWLRNDGKALRVSCTCPYYAGNVAICKHIWATVLAANQKGYLRDFVSTGRVDFDREGGVRGQPNSSTREHQVKPAPPPVWMERLNELTRATPERRESTRWPAEREIVYLVDVPVTLSAQSLTVQVSYRDRKKNLEWTRIKPFGVSAEQVARLPNPLDREILSLLVCTGGDPYYGIYGTSARSRFWLKHPAEQTLIPMMCQTGRCRLSAEGQVDYPEIVWDDGPPWKFSVDVRPNNTSQQYVVVGSLRRGDEQMDLTEPALVLSGGLVFTRERAARFDDSGAFDLISRLRRMGPLHVPMRSGPDLIERILAIPGALSLHLPDELKVEEVEVAPQPRLKITRRDNLSYWGPPKLYAELSFSYEGVIIRAGQTNRGTLSKESRRFILRDQPAEQAADDLLRQVGFRQGYSYETRKQELTLAGSKLPRATRTLLEAGWHIEADGKLYRQPGAVRIEISSGIDWFELGGEVDFGGASATLPALLAALKRGDDTVLLGDGTFGLLSEEWLARYGLLIGLGKADEDHLRFTRSQVGLLDALLAAQPEVTFDANFARARDELMSFEGVQPTLPPAGFTGELRPYQCEGLGWLHFLQRFGFGGCLADDMGLGKTVMVLALLESRRRLRANGKGQPGESKRRKKSGASEGNGSLNRPGPSLVVVPRSIVFNWKQEAARFTPALRVLDHTGVERLKAIDHFDDYDLVITTYGTLRRDAIQFKDKKFDYVILDESQAIKNASTESAKAARLLLGDHRLALSGTPVENHLGELWSLFEFLNPGLLGSASAFKLGGGALRNPDEQTRVLLSRALRPFILRRTKAQVATELPPKLEQTIYCEMEPVQRKLYDELRDHYRGVLLGRIEREGMNRSKMQILEALLRLRQAACHPGLIDKTRTLESSAKLDVLLPQLAEVIEEGHKALVFSQFTSLLAIVRERLDREKINYEYLDGRTRDRQARVEIFQNDPECRLFLISLKAGGLGLNLTAAEYVFLLDPWWNPAVEAQAIDRAYRIGQTRHVFAYRLIARDTVEEKVLELQKTKRELADAIINADNSLIRSLGREDLELLLS